MITTSPQNRTSRRVVAGALAALAISATVLGAAAIRGSADPVTVRLAQPPPSTTGATAEDARAVPASDGLPDGRHFGRLRGAYVAPDEVVLDTMELVDDDDDGGAFRVRDLAGGPHTVPVRGDVAATEVVCGDGGCTEGVPVTYGALTRKVDAAPGADAFWVTIEGGEVVRIDEQHLP